MSEDIETSAPMPPGDIASPEAAAVAARPGRRGSGTAWLAAALAVVALGASGFALWRVRLVEQGRADAQAALGARLDDLARGLDQRKRDVDSLRARLGDNDGVNKSLREELLGLGERSRHLEDAVANLAEQRQSGRDALAMNEAEFLLQLAQERLALFHDAAAADAAYGLADSALAAAEDPVFASVRQTIGAERRALAASKPAATQATLTALETLRGGLPALAARHAGEAAAAPSRWQAFLAQFVRISHSDETGAAGAPRDLELARLLAAVDLRAAEAALLARDADAYRAALARARSGIAAGFDAKAPAVQSALAEIDRLAAAPLAPPPPELGGALKELRNLRATRALSQPARPAAPAAAPPAPDGAAS